MCKHLQIWGARGWAAAGPVGAAAIPAKSTAAIG